MLHLSPNYFDILPFSDSFAVLILIQVDSVYPDISPNFCLTSTGYNILIRGI